MESSSMLKCLLSYSCTRCFIILLRLYESYFEQMLATSDKIYATKDYKPKEMTIPFTADEIKKASNGLKNGKSPGIDNLHAEFIKYAPDV